MTEQAKEIVLRCPLCTLSTVRLPLIDESGIALVSDPQRLRILRGGKIFRISGSRKSPIVAEVSHASLSLDDKIVTLPDFGFEPGNLVWISAMAANGYEDHRILKELPERLAKKHA